MTSYMPCAPPCPQPEGRDLVEDEHDAELVADAAEHFDEGLFGRRVPDAGGDEVDDDARHPVRLLPQHGFRDGGVVEGDDDGVVQHVRQGVGAIGEGTREALRAGHDRRRVGDLRVVVGAVVQALALHDLGALGQRAGRLDGVHHGLGAAAAENDPLGARHPGAQVLGEQDLGPLGHPEADPAVQLLLQGGYGGRVPVTVDEHHEVVGAVQQGVAVDVADPAAEPRMNV